MEFGFNCDECDANEECMARDNCVGRDHLELLVEGLIEIIRKRDKEIAEQCKALKEWKEFYNKNEWKLSIDEKDINKKGAKRKLKK
jgi:hypothetical protein